MDFTDLFPLLTFTIVMILVGIFLAPVITDLTSGRERQENHFDLDDLIKQKERLLLGTGQSAPIPLDEWRRQYPGQTKSLETFLTWGEDDLLTQINQELESPIGSDELRQLLQAGPPSSAPESDLVGAILLVKKGLPPA